MVNDFFALKKRDSLLRVFGFTLIELLVVLAIIALLLTISTPKYFQSIETTKETVLVENLKIARDAIDKFYGDKGRYPNSLEELVEKKYLRSVPIDPVSQLPWQMIEPVGGENGQIFDIKSTSPGTNQRGVPFSTL
jgi:general secretion pathway protein G